MKKHVKYTPLRDFPLVKKLFSSSHPLQCTDESSREAIPWSSGVVQCLSPSRGPRRRACSDRLHEQLQSRSNGAASVPLAIATRAMPMEHVVPKKKDRAEGCEIDSSTNIQNHFDAPLLQSQRPLRGPRSISGDGRFDLDALKWAMRPAPHQGQKQ